MEDKHFDKVFWFIVLAVVMVFIFDCAVIFVPVPNVGTKYADILVGSLNTGVLMACINYLLGGTPDKKKPAITATGDSPVINNNPPADAPIIQ